MQLESELELDPGPQSGSSVADAVETDTEPSQDLDHDRSGEPEEILLAEEPMQRRRRGNKSKQSHGLVPLGKHIAKVHKPTADFIEARSQVLQRQLVV